MRPVNLIPPEERRGDAAPLRTGPLPYVLLGVLAVALLTVTALVLTGNSIKDRKAELEALEVREANARAAADALTPYTQFATLAAARDATVTSLAESRFDWERVLRELSLVIPEDVSLVSVAASTGPGSGDDSGTASNSNLTTGVTGPVLALSGCAHGQKGVAGFAATLEDIDGVTRVGVGSSHLATGAAGPGGSASSTEECSGGASVSAFNVVAVFDGVPAPAAATATPPATGGPATTNATPEQQQATDSAAEQTEKGRKAANLVPGVDQ